MMLEGRIALVTGSTQGIGAAIARVLARQGAALALHGLCSEEEGRSQAEALAREHGVACEFFPGDLADGAQADALVARVHERWGRLDVLVNNAGIQHTAPVAEFPPEKWDAILAINLTAPFRLMRQAVPLMRSGGWGRIVNIASVHGLVASVNKAAYCAAKHGLVGLTKVVALETAREGITVNAVCPGWTETPILEPQIQARAAAKGLDRAAAIRDLVTEKQPNGMLMPAAWIADTVLFLCSEAGTGITGTALSVDGGWTAQ